MKKPNGVAPFAPFLSIHDGIFLKCLHAFQTLRYDGTLSRSHWRPCNVLAIALILFFSVNGETLAYRGTFSGPPSYSTKRRPASTYL
jgi:hypothetical protein